VKLTSLAIRFRVTVLVLTALTLAGGLLAYAALPKEASPSIQIPVVIVTVLFPGAGPEEIEALVTFPIERELQGIEGVVEIRSTAREGLSLVVVEFDTGEDITDASQRVRDRVDIARAELPAEAEEPRVEEFNLEDLPILNVNLLAPYALARLTDVAERLQEEIETLPGVLEATLTGGIEREVQVNVNAGLLEGYGLSFDEIAQVIEQENASLPGGAIDVGRESIRVRVDGRFDDPARIADLVVAAPGQRPVYIRDVAEVVAEGFADRQSYARLREIWREDERGRPVAVEHSEYQEAVTLAVRPRSGENVMDIAGAVRGLVDAFALPEGTTVVYTADRSEGIAVLLQEMENHIVLGVLLVGLSLLLFLGLRAALLAALSIPLTMMLTFIIFLALGETLNFIVLFGLIVVLGILVDFSIVVVENIQRQAEQGASSWEAAMRAARQVGWPVTAGLLTTMVVFVPLLFWGGVTGEFMYFLPLTLIISLTSALLVALTMVPVAAGYLLVEDGGRPRSGGRQRAVWIGAGIVAAVVILLANPVTLVAVAMVGAVLVALYRFVMAPGTDWFRGRALPAMERRYGALLARSLVRTHDVRRPWLRNAGALSALAAGLALLVLGGVIYLGLGLRPALAVLVPGGVLAAVGIAGVLVHGLETLFLGGVWSVRAGAALGLVYLPFLARHLLAGELTPAMALSLLLVPGVCVVAGALGALLAPRRRHLLLTDNRARVLCLAVGSALLVAVAYAIAPTGAAFFPTTDPDQVRVNIEAPGGTNVEASNAIAERVVARIEALIEQDPAVRANIQNILVNVGVTGRGPFGAGQPDVRRSRLTITFVEFRHRAESSRETLAKIRHVLDRFAGAVVTVEEDQMGPPTGPPVEIEVTGPDFPQVLAIAVNAERRLREAVAAGRVRGLVDLVNTSEPGSPELRVRVDRERASLFGVSTLQVATTVRSAVEGRIAGTHREGENEYDIRVRLREEDRQTPDSLQALTIVTPDARVPLVSMADLEPGTGPGTITRVDLRPVVTLEGQVADGFATDEVLQQIDGLLDDLRAALPDGYSLRFAGEAEEREEAFDFLGFALLLGVGLIALVLVSKFNSVVVPVIILSAVLLTMTGVVAGMILAQTAFGLMTFLAIISLAGIVADDDIVLSTFVLQGYARHDSVDAAVLDAGVARFRQVVLTAITTILGLVPLTIGFHMDFQGFFTQLRPDLAVGSANSQFWGPLGGAVIAGLPAAAAVTLLVVPVAFSAMESVRREASAWWHGTSP
jgi:multidrug efflux pump